ncbi:LysR family transcriptional regulator [Bradyrhizobium sp. LA7.1]|uniref:LysR family transcriptional regulator n=1 Tax=Bradyrhizobium sp. LA7.1 TaxID=3156324 RepID=UPI003395AB54
MKKDSVDRARELEVFAAIVEAAGVSAGGRTVGLSPSGASRTLQRLESRLGVRLLVRASRAFRLTEEGESYYRSGRRILNDLDEVEQTLGDQAAPRGRLRVSSSIAFGRVAILPALGAFQHAYPGISMELSLTDHIADLSAGEADLAVRVGDLPDSDLKARKLGESPRILVASPEYLARSGAPITPEDLTRHNCLRFSFRPLPATWPFRRGDEHFDIEIVGNIAVDNGDAIMQLALAGHGIARVGHFHVQRELEAGRLVPLLEDFDTGETESFHAVFVGGRTIPGRVRAFVDFFAGRVGRP